MENLGRGFNLATSATTANTRFSVRDCEVVSIVLIGATSGAATVQEHDAAASGTSQSLSAITHYWRQNNGVWTEVTQAEGATFTAGTGGLAVCEINTTALSDGFGWVSASHATGSFVFAFGDLNVQRWPANLQDIRA